MKYTIRTIVSATFALIFGMSAMAQTADQYIYFDLAAGGVTINASTYSGKVYVNGKATTVSGTHSASNKYYVYQSSSIAGSPGLASETGYETQDDFNQRQNIRIPQYANVRYDGKNWDEYVKNNTTDPNIICDNWDASAAQVLRSSTGNRIIISGKNLVCDITIDNLWSSYCPEPNNDYCQGGIKIGTNNTEQVTIRLKNYSKLFNVFYHRNSGKSGFLKFTSSDGDNSTNGSLTVIQTTKEWKNNDREHSLIGGYYGSSTDGKGSDEYSNSYGMFFNGGSIYAGKAEIENSIWSDKVNNDQDGAIGGGATGAGEITINGGVITSVCHTTSAAIGGGAAMSLQGGKGIVTINGGEVYAYGYGVYVSGSKTIVPVSAIGGGSTSGRTDNRGGDAEVTINGGYVYAQSIGGTAIGGGNDGVGSGGNAKVTITGGTIEAKSLSGKISDFDVEVSNAVGGGTGGVTSGKPGGNVEMTISGSPTITVGSIGGGKTNNKKGKIGTAQIDISGNPLISGQFILAAGAGTAPKFTMTSGTICNSSTFDTQFPKVQANGGAVYIEDGTVTMSGGTISGCTALNGGAFYIQGGTFTTSGNSIISGNTAAKDDEGNGGNGGGLYVDGGKVTFGNGHITNNTAFNGGGLFLASGASMGFTGGIIKGNHAIASNDYEGPYTAYPESGISDQEGFGGGFYVQSGTSEAPSTLSVQIAEGTDFGIYDNDAATGADDILAEGVNTSVTIPNVKDMQLAEFSTSAYPNWYEDYNAEDNNYDKGLKLHSGCTTYDRFVNMLNDAVHYVNHRYLADGTAIANKYLNFKLGYESLQITISATGLNEKETAYYQLVHHDIEGDVFYPILLLGDGSPMVSKTIVGLPWGSYSAILDKKWTWAYDVTVPNADGRYENIPIVGVTEYEFPFTVEHISGVKNVLHDEEYKVNEMLNKE